MYLFLFKSNRFSVDSIVEIAARELQRLHNVIYSSRVVQHKIETSGQIYRPAIDYGYSVPRFDKIENLIQADNIQQRLLLFFQPLRFFRNKEIKGWDYP